MTKITITVTAYVKKLPPGMDLPPVEEISRQIGELAQEDEFVKIEIGEAQVEEVA